jgi:hypothetical protein
MRKQIFTALFALIVSLASFSVVSTAELPNEQQGQAQSIAPRWTNAQSIILSLTFSGGRANASSLVEGQPSVSKITATYSLQEKSGSSWKTVHTWSSVSTNFERT